MGSYTNSGMYNPTSLVDSTNAWGTDENNGRTLVDSLVSGYLALPVAGSANVVLTKVNGATDQQRNWHFNFTGALTGNIIVLYPQNQTKQFSVANNTTGAFTLSIGANNGAAAAAGTTITVPQGQSMALGSDGTNVYSRVTAAAAFTTIQVIAGAGLTGGGTLTANVTLNANVLSVAGRTGAVVLSNTDIAGLGSASIQNIATSGANVPLLSGNNTWGAGQTLTVNDGGGSAFNAGYLETPISGGAAKTVNYTTLVTDSGKTVLSNAAALTHSIASNAAVPYNLGTCITFINIFAGNLSIAINTDTMTLVNSVTTGTRTLAQNGIATAIKVAATSWLISGTGLT